MLSVLYFTFHKRCSSTFYCLASDITLCISSNKMYLRLQVIDNNVLSDRGKKVKIALQLHQMRFVCKKTLASLVV